MDEHGKQLFLQLIQDNRARIYRLCKAYARCNEDLQDLFQEVLFNLWKSRSTFKGDSQITTWLYRVTLNVCMQYSMRLQRGSGLRLERIPLISDEANAEQRLEQQEQIALLYECIGKLNEVDKTLMLLYLEDLPYRDIGLVMGLSENNIAQKVNRIKHKLFQCLKNCDYAG
jgi:RNA polymerase sigma-70 factor (ECF subfamily)